MGLVVIAAPFRRPVSCGVGKERVAGEPAPGAQELVPPHRGVHRMDRVWAFRGSVSAVHGQHSLYLLVAATRAIAQDIFSFFLGGLIGGGRRAPPETPLRSLRDLRSLGVGFPSFWAPPDLTNPTF